MANLPLFGTTKDLESEDEMNREISDSKEGKLWMAAQVNWGSGNSTVSTPQVTG